MSQAANVNRAELSPRRALVAEQAKEPSKKVTCPPRAPWVTIATATATSCMALVTLVVVGKLSGEVLLIPPMAASMALVAGAPALPLSQPRNVIGGQVLSAIVGVVAGLVAHNPWVAAIAGGLALGAMLIARMAHSPAAATAVLGSLVHGRHHCLVFVACVAVAAVIVTAYGWFRSLAKGPNYPTYWI